MLVYLIVLMLLVVSGMQVAKKDQFFTGYLSKEQTTAINGIFVLIVFLSHASTYVELGGPLDAAYSTLKGYLRQLIVASFLFYSGYGMLESIKKNYTKFELSMVLGFEKPYSYRLYEILKKDAWRLEKKKAPILCWYVKCWNCGRESAKHVDPQEAIKDWRFNRERKEE